MSRLVEQVSGYAALIDDHADLFADLYGALLSEPLAFHAPTESWIVWPRRGIRSDPKEQELRSRGIRLVTYELGGNNYRFTAGNRAAGAAPTAL